MLKKIFNYFRESKDELKKVVWPTKSQAYEMMVAVIIVVLIISFYLGAIDYLLSKATAWLFKK